MPLKWQAGETTGLRTVRSIFMGGIRLGGGKGGCGPAGIWRSRGGRELFSRRWGKGTDVGNGFVGGAGAGVAAGAMAFFGDEFGCGMAVGPGGVFLVVGDVLADAIDGVGVDLLGQGGRAGRRVLSVWF